MTKFDYIIAGAAPAGRVLANRLSADPEVEVLLIEAGDDAEPGSQVGDHHSAAVADPRARAQRPPVQRKNAQPAIGHLGARTRETPSPAGTADLTAALPTTSGSC